MKITRDRSIGIDFCYIGDIEYSLGSYTNLRKTKSYFCLKEVVSKNSYLYYSYIVI